MAIPGEILKKAWEAVQEAGLPESMQDTAFREAVAILRDDDGGTEARRAGGGNHDRTPSPVRRPKVTPTRKRTSPVVPSIQLPDQEAFFADLSHESGVSETELRDVLSLGADGTVNVTPPTRTLGDSKAAQARCVVALVAAARLVGLKESPVSADAVRKEAQRKHCFDTNNFGSTVIGQLDGFNYGGSRAEIVITSKWVNEFQGAVNQAQGRSAEGNKTDDAKG